MPAQIKFEEKNYEKMKLNRKAEKSQKEIKSLTKLGIFGIVLYFTYTFELHKIDYVQFALDYSSFFILGLVSLCLYLLKGYYDYR